MTDELSQLERQEQIAQAFRARYGLTDEDVWSDELMDQVLIEYGFPVLDQLPAEPRGMMRSFASPEELDGPLGGEAARRWQRVNGMHFLAHAMLHNGRRCAGCADW